MPTGGLMPAEQATSQRGLRKAAVLMVTVGPELATPMLRELSARDVEKLTAEMMRMEEVPPSESEEVLAEFEDLLVSRRYSLRGGDDFAANVLAGAFGADQASSILEKARRLPERTNSGGLETLRRANPQQLAKFLESEQPQTIALVLAHLDADKGASLLMNLKQGQRVEAVKKLAELKQFSPDAAQTVASVLTGRMESLQGGERVELAGRKSVAELLNRIDGSVGKSILEEIEQTTPILAISIRDMMFRFEDLITVPPNSIREILSALDKRVLALALKGTKENLRAHIFKAMSSRAMEMLQEDMEALGPVRNREIAKAQQEVLAEARRLEAEGKLVLAMEVEGEFAL